MEQNSMNNYGNDAGAVGLLLHDWQKERSEWHGPTTLEVVREYAEWREARSLSSVSREEN